MAGSLSPMRHKQLHALEFRGGLGIQGLRPFQVAFNCLSGHVNGFFSGVTLSYNISKFGYSHSKSTRWLRSEYDFKLFELVHGVP